MTTPSTNATTSQVLRAALLGAQTSHSVSPQLHELLFPILCERSGGFYSSIEYTKIDLPDATALREWLRNAAAHGIKGANVTNPHKYEVYEAATTHYGVSRELKAANTLSFFDNRIVAASTDGEGFMSALNREIAHFDLSRYHFITLGAGATAKSVLYSMLTRWMPLSFTLAGRSVQRANELMEFVSSNSPGPTLKLTTLEDLKKETRPEEPCVVLNTTPLGQGDNRENILPDFDWQEDDIALDVVYNPFETEFLKRAEEAGARRVSGLGMLIEQAALSQTFWLTNEIPTDSPLTLEEYFEIKSKLKAIITATNG
jgi:shikimate dehydrogenase